MIRDKIRNRRYAAAKLNLYGMRGKKITTIGKRGWYPITAEGTGIKKSYDARQLSEVYTKSGLIFACIRELATSISDLDLQIGSIDSEGTFVPQENNELVDLFYENPWYSYAQIIELFVSRLYLTGAQFTKKIPTVNGALGALAPLPTSIVKMETKGLEIVGYKLGDDETSIPPDEILEHRFIYPGSYHCYTSPLQTVMSEYMIDEEREAITKQLLHNKNMPGYFLKPRENLVLTEPQQQLLKDSIDQATGAGSANRGKGIVLPSAMDVEIGPNVEDIDYTSLNSLTESRICMAFQVPPIIIGAKTGIDTSTYSNYETARKSYYEETTIPLASFLTAGFNRHLLPADSKLQYRFDFSDIAELQEDMNKMAERSTLLFEKGVAKRDESRAMVNLPPIGGDEGGFRPSLEPQPPISDEVQFPDRMSGGGSKTLGKQEEIPQVKPQKAAAAIGTFPDSVPLEMTLKREFRKQKEEALTMLRETGSVDMAQIGKTLGTSIFNTLLTVAGVEAMSTLRKMQRDGLIASDEDKIHGKDASLEAAFDVVQMDLEKRIATQSLELSATTMATTTKKMDSTLAALREELIAVGVRGPNTIKALEEGVKRVFENAEDYRARQIAITESSRAVNDAKITAGSSSGVVQGFSPVVSPDACELCQVYRPDGSPTGTPLFPYTDMDSAKAQVGEIGNRTLPPYHPNCLTGETPCFAVSPKVAFVTTYCGPIVEITLADGRRISATVNHMFLTPHGFAKAEFISNGDYILDASRFDGVICGGPNNNGKPTSIQDIIETFSESRGVSTVRMPLTAENLHGDSKFCHGDIHIIAPDGFLKGDVKTVGNEHIGQDSFKARNSDLIDFVSLCNLRSMLFALRDATDGGMGRLREKKAFRLAKSGHSNFAGSRSITQSNPIFSETSSDWWSADAKALAECQNAFAGKITTAKVVNVNIRDFLGHVYDLHTTSSMYLANGLVSSNCRCTVEPILITETPPAKSGEKMEQLGKRPSETPRPRPGGRPEAPLPLGSFVTKVVNKVKGER